MTKRVNKGFSLVELSIVILIIGVLVAAVGQGLDLLTDSRLSAARVITQGSRVASLKNLVLWLETTKEESINLDQAQNGVGRIATWNDINPQTTSPNNAVQSNTDFQPTYISNCIGGLPCLRFDGTNDFMDTTVNLNLRNAWISVFIVASSKDFLSTSYNILTTLNEGGNPPSGAVICEFSTDVNLQRIALNIPGLRTITSPQNVLKSQSQIFAIVNGENGARGYINSSVRDDYAVGTAIPLLQFLEIGAFPNQGSTARTRYLNGDISEIIVFNRALSVKETESVQAYLSKKWSIKLK